MLLFHAIVAMAYTISYVFRSDKPIQHGFVAAVYNWCMLVYLSSFVFYSDDSTVSISLIRVASALKCFF